MDRFSAAKAFAKGKRPRTNCALTFQGNVAYSYEEPIAIRNGSTLHVSGYTGGESLKSMFSQTTAMHVGIIRGRWAIENGPENVNVCPHGNIRKMAADLNMPMGHWGKRFENR